MLLSVLALAILPALDVPTTDASAAAPGDPALEAIDAFIEKSAINTEAQGWRTTLPRPPKVTFDADTDYYWDLETNLGTIRVELLPRVAPMHASSTIYLTRLGFYDGLDFHRVIQNFMAQGGCPLGKGTGGPGYKYAGEFDSSVRHDRPGMLSMANSGPGTDGSQFFLTFKATPWLDGKHTIFGKVIDGMDVVRALEKAGSSDDSGRTTERLFIQKATVVAEKREPLPSAADSDNPALAAMAEFISQQAIDKEARGWKTRLPRPPQLDFSSPATWYWNIRTSKGDIKIRLMPDVAPMHVSSTIFLTRVGYYDDLVFHRVIPDFMAQGGCPLGRGTGGPGYKYAGEFSDDVKHTEAGMLSMANAGAGTDGSQFFLTFKPTPWLDGKHTIFGQVVEGMDVLEAMEKVGSRSGKTSEVLRMDRATISVE